MIARQFLFRLGALGLLSSGLVACDVSRPMGAFTYDAGVINKTDYGYDDDGDTSEPPDELEPDAGAPPKTDPGMPADDDTSVDDPENPLTALQGDYLMRVDVYSKASVTKSGITVATSNRVSNLLLARVRLGDDGKLNSQETLCHQSYYTSCLSNCSNWKTTVNPTVTKQYFPKQVVNRGYDVDASGKLGVGRSVLALGFDEQEGVSALPSDTSDARAWKVMPGTETVYGLNTHVEATVGTAITTQLDCYVSAVQRFATAFSGQLDLTKGAEALTQRAMRVDTEGTAGATIAARGTPADQCTKASIEAAGSQPNASTAVVRFRRTDQAICPASIAQYEAAFPGVNEEPRPADLM